MELNALLEYLEDLAEKLGVEVVYEQLGDEETAVRGGLCKVNGMYKIFVDRSDSMKRRVELLARSLSLFDTEDVYVLPFVRGILEGAQRAGADKRWSAIPTKKRKAM